MTDAALIQRHNLSVTGSADADETIVFVHGYGSNRDAWRFVVRAFEQRHRIVLYDLAGCGGSHPESWSRERYSSLDAWAADLIEICDSLGAGKRHLVAHSVGAMIGTRALLERPGLFDSAVFLCASPRYVNDGDYLGGFTDHDVDVLLDRMSANYTLWAAGFARTVAAVPDNPSVVDEFARSLAMMRPDVSISIANLIFRSDFREEVTRLTLPVSLVYASADFVVPAQAARYLHEHIPGSTLHWISTSGHLPHLTAPEDVVRAVRAHVESHGISR